MSDDEHDEGDLEREEHDEGDDALLASLSAALTREGELFPTGEDEVARAEGAGVERIELPEHLEELPPERAAAAPAPARPSGAASARGGTLDLDAHRRRRAAERPWLTHTATLILGAAAALALFLFLGDDVRSPLGLGTDPATGSSSTAPAPLRVELPAGCADCCGGEACTSAREGLARCSSGRRCVPCAAPPGSRYRLRVGAVHLAEAGRAVIDLYPQGEAELCLRVGASGERCVPILLTERPEAEWRSLPLVAAADDLGAKVAVRLRWKGVKEPLATAARWLSPLAASPTALCMGYSVKLEVPPPAAPAPAPTAEPKLFGTASLFLDDAHHVELARAADVASLRALASRLELGGVRVFIQETSAAESDRFVLGFGPFPLPTAEKVRWQLAEQGETPRLGEGQDYLGEPLALP